MPHEWIVGSRRRQDSVATSHLTFKGQDVRRSSKRDLYAREHWPIAGAPSDVEIGL
jgi:hypothetical protein